MGRVFISYMREDTKAANDLVRLMTANGVTTWIDRSDLHAGANWPRKIRRAIERAEFFVPVFSRSYGAKRRSYFNKEVRIALGMMDEVHDGQEWILPLRLHDIDPPHIEVGDFDVADLHFTDLFGSGLTDNLERLLTQLGVAQPDLSAPKRDGAPLLRID